MKKIVLSLFVAAISFATNAQIKSPAPSPSQKIEQKVGLTDITVDYSRPSMKGRKIFGGLESYGKVWRTGANANTKLTFSTDFTIDGKEMKKGTYALYTIPGKETWNIILYTDATNWGNPKKWDDFISQLLLSQFRERMCLHKALTLGFTLGTCLFS